MYQLIFLLVAYLIGSVSTAIIVCKSVGAPDPRTEGSKNPGATNVLRIAGKQAAISVLLADAMKGLLAVLIARVFGVSGFGLGLVAAAVTAGHIFPAFYGFKGGKGVATAIGSIIGLNPFAGIIATIIWAATVAITRFASLSAIIAVGISPVLLMLFGRASYFVPTAIVAALVIWKHMDNIQRLRDGTESKVQL